MCVWNSMLVWILYRSFWQKWNFISGDKISCKHYSKWNAYTCSSEYRVVLKYSRNETSCELNLFLHRFKMSNWYEFILLLMWTCSYSACMFWFVKKVNCYSPSYWKFFFIFYYIYLHQIHTFEKVNISLDGMCELLYKSQSFSWSFIKIEMGDNEWQRMTTNGGKQYSGWYWVTKNDK